METLNNKLKELRELNNLSLDELASKSNVSLKELEKIEQKKINPSLKIAMKIAKALGKEVEEVFYL